MSTILNAHEYGAASQVVAVAIDRSISHDEIVHVDGYRMRDAIIQALHDECENATDDGQGGTEFWGTNIDGENWRVHVSPRGMDL